jgi:hypothetical protein
LRDANERLGTNWRTIGLFLLLAIGWPWLVVPLFGILGLLRIPGLAQILIALLVMPAPAAAALVTSRVMHRQRLSQDGLRLLGVNWRAVAVVPLAFVLFALLYLLLLQLLGNVGQLPGVGQLDVHGAAIVDNLRRLNPGLPTTAIRPPPDSLLIPIFIGGALLAGVSINALFALVGSIAGLVGIAALALVALLLHVADRDYVANFPCLPS